MKSSLIVITVLAIFMVPSICAATPPRPGPYVSLFAGASIPNNTNATTFDSNVNRTFYENVEFDTGVYAGGTAGFDFGFVRLEGEVSYRFSDIKNVTDNPSGFQFTDINGGLGALAVMVNGFVDLHNQSPITPYLGGGIGFAVLHMDNVTGFDSRPPAGRVNLYPDADDTVFAWQLGAGLEFALTPFMSVDVGYRYFETDNATFNSGFLNTSNVKLKSHNGVVGLRLKF
ncbi:MAG TPA: outer membrane beta-barrel protein [Geobacteraceae bacterium]|nr:outer membrane beta-barrel protein [Geobacteraceae bacterium]